MSLDIPFFPEFLTRVSSFWFLSLFQFAGFCSGMSGFCDPWFSEFEVLRHHFCAFQRLNGLGFLRFRNHCHNLRPVNPGFHC